MKAAAEMEGLTSIVVNEAEVLCALHTRDAEKCSAEARLTAYINGLMRSLGHRLIQRPQKHVADSKGATGTRFVEIAKQPVLSTGLQLATNLRVMASEAAFPKVEDLVEDMVSALHHARLT